MLKDGDRQRGKKLLESKHLFIREFLNKSGSVSYRVGGNLPVDTAEHPAGRVRENFDNYEDARDRLNHLEDLLKHIELVESITRVATRLTPAQVKTAEYAIAELGDLPVNHLVEAVLFWKQHRTGTDPTMTLRQALASCTIAKTKARRDGHTIRGYKTAVESFLRKFGTPNGQFDECGIEIRDIRIAYISRAQIKEWVEEFPIRGTGVDYMRLLSSVLSWCVANGKLTANPALKVPLEQISKQPKVIHILENFRTQAMLDKAAVYKNGIGLPYIIVCLFGAVRLEEAPKILIEEVNLERNFIRLIHTKKRLRRIVELSENAAEILRVYWRDRQGTFAPKNLRRILAVIKAAAGYRDDQCPKRERPEGWEKFPAMPDNVMRHTGLSNKLTATGDVVETTRWGGNSPDTFYEYYFGLVDKGTSAQFWALRPKSMPTNPDFLERVRSELVEWRLLKVGEALPSPPDVPTFEYRHVSRKDGLLSLSPEQVSILVAKRGLVATAAECYCSVNVLARFCRKNGIATNVETKTGPQPERAGLRYRVFVPEPVPPAPRTELGFIDWAKISDEELYDWIWTWPKQQIADAWGVVYNTILKEIKKRKLSTPGWEFWDAVAKGLNPAKPPFRKAA